MIKEVLRKHSIWLLDKNTGSRADLRYANLSSADLRYADLRYADLSSADLSSAGLRYADLSSADLRNAGLSSADLSIADLSSANLSSADLRSANLSSADLRSANLSSANLSNADLRDANLRDSGLKLFQAGRYTAYIQKEHIRIGCRYHRAEDWWAFDDAAISTMARDALEYWQENKAVIRAIWESL